MTGWREWLRRLAGPDPEVERLRGLLLNERQWRRRVQGENRALRLEVQRAYQHKPGGTCAKVRYLHLDDVERHAVQMAVRFNSPFVIYECEQCPVFPVVFRKSWHVANGGGKGSIGPAGDGRVTRRGCSCAWDLTGALLSTCSRHERARRKVPTIDPKYRPVVWSSDQEAAGA